MGSLGRAPVVALIEQAIGRPVARLEPLAGGCVARVYRVGFAKGRQLVAKCADATGELETEAYMLGYLREHSTLPVPVVHHASPELLIMDYVDSGDPIDSEAEMHAAELLTALHGVRGECYGHERDTLIGGLPQPNPPTARWLDFFRDWRLLHMAQSALEAGRISSALMARIERFAGRLDSFIEEPAWPSLIHGDLWAGNILVRRGRVVGLVDPAIYYADAEIELAFATLFGSLGEAFFERYGAARPIRAGFFEARRDLYNLYPLLVHARLFGGHYVQAVEHTLARFGG